MSKKLIITVLGVHTAILLFIGGGLSALGAAVMLLIPVLGTATWTAYQLGQTKAENRRRAIQKRQFNAFANFCPFSNFRG